MAEKLAPEQQQAIDDILKKRGEKRPSMVRNLAARGKELVSEHGESIFSTLVADNIFILGATKLAIAATKSYKEARARRRQLDAEAVKAWKEIQAFKEKELRSEKTFARTAKGVEKQRQSNQQYERIPQYGGTALGEPTPHYGRVPTRPTGGGKRRGKGGKPKLPDETEKPSTFKNLLARGKETVLEHGEDAYAGAVQGNIVALAIGKLTVATVKSHKEAKARRKELREEAEEEARWNEEEVEDEEQLGKRRERVRSHAPPAMPSTVLGEPTPQYERVPGPTHEPTYGAQRERAYGAPTFEEPQRERIGGGGSELEMAAMAGEALGNTLLTVIELLTAIVEIDKGILAAITEATEIQEDEADRAHVREEISQAGAEESLREKLGGKEGDEKTGKGKLFSKIGGLLGGGGGGFGFGDIIEWEVSKKLGRWTGKVFGLFRGWTGKLFGIFRGGFGKLFGALAIPLRAAIGGLATTLGTSLTGLLSSVSASVLTFGETLLAAVPALIAAAPAALASAGGAVAAAGGALATGGAAVAGAVPLVAAGGAAALGAGMLGGKVYDLATKGEKGVRKDWEEKFGNQQKYGDAPNIDDLPWYSKPGAFIEAGVAEQVHSGMKRWSSDPEYKKQRDSDRVFELKGKLQQLDEQIKQGKEQGKSDEEMAALAVEQNELLIELNKTLKEFIAVPWSSQGGLSPKQQEMDAQVRQIALQKGGAGVRRKLLSSTYSMVSGEQPQPELSYTPIGGPAQSGGPLYSPMGGPKAPFNVPEKAPLLYTPIAGAARKRKGKGGAGGGTGARGGEGGRTRGAGGTGAEPLYTPVTGDIGAIARSEESAGAGPGTVSTGVGDFGGVSYGSYQLSSNKGTVQSFLKKTGYSEQFQGLQPGSPEFSSRWKELAKSDPSFGSAQQSFMEQTHYAPLMSNLAKSGIDLESKGPAVQSAVFSTATQYGPNSSVIQRALKGKDVKAMSSAEIISAIQENKAAHVETDFKSSSQRQRAGVAKRIPREQKKLLQMAAAEQAKPAMDQTARAQLAMPPPTVPTMEATTRQLGMGRVETASLQGDIETARTDQISAAAAMQPPPSGMGGGGGASGSGGGRPQGEIGVAGPTDSTAAALQTKAFDSAFI